MRKQILVISLLLIFFVNWGHPAAAQFKLGAQLGYGLAKYSKPAGDEEVISTDIKEWTTYLAGNYTYNDLLLTGFYRSGQAWDGPLKHSLAQICANYSILEEDLLQVYAGLGYQFLHARLEHPDPGSEGKFEPRSNSFLGQVIVAIDVMENLEAITTITAAPRLTWNLDTPNGAGNSFNYSLDLIYDFKDEYGLRFGLMGGNYKIRDLKIKTSYTGANLGLTWHF
ncbi:MAG: hypothetical protein GX335_07640 [Firmicutes bacterium]|nr:hypothetical protein [Bacillota bacterium]